MSDVSSPSGVPQLSQEIIDLIIDSLLDDYDFTSQATPIFKEYAAISHTFLLSARRHLFSSIKIFSVDEVMRFYNLLSSAPDIARNVRRLQVQIVEIELGNPVHSPPA
jgi:hypothetical protein